MGSSFSNELGILCGVPQESILGSLLFNIDICDLLFVVMSSDMANYADDTTLYELTIYKIFNWFKYNNFKSNATKCHFVVSPDQSATINIDGSIIKSSNSQKLLGVTIDSNFTFEEHLNNVYQKSSQTLHTLC